ncbi:MAG: SurA N-terminal domain-containing protein [Thermodesulfobacteriota bacterium]|nr:SurA N-terminal domain-containing protein [Thermodesulfobacteriota bacterium]
MLDLIRKKAGSWMVKAIIFLIAVVFVFWGVNIRDKAKGTIASVNDEPITLDEYNRTYDNLKEQVRRRFGDRLNDEMIASLGLRKQALNQLVEKKLMLMEAKRLNFRVTDEELKAAIRNIDAFQTDGVFDSRRYNRILSSVRLTPETFEVEQKEAMLTEKLRAFITGNVKVSEQEAREYFEYQDASVDIDFVLFATERYKNVRPTDDEIKAYFEKHKETYKTEVRLKAKYLHFNPDSFKPEVKIDNDELLDYYETNQSEFYTPKTVEASHILIKVAKDADAQTVEKAKKRALEIMKMAREGKNFSDLAKKYSEGPTRFKGGSLGAFKKEAMVKPFSDKAFSMKSGEISEPVRTRFGWHIIKVDKINQEFTVSFDKARLKIKEKLLTQKAGNLAYDKADEVYEASDEGDDLKKLADLQNFTLHTTDFFTKKNPVKGVADSAKFTEAAFNMELREISDIQDLTDGFYIIQVIEKIDEKIPPLEDVKQEVKVVLTDKKREEKARADAKQLLAALKAGGGIESLEGESVKSGLKMETTGFFKRNGSIKNIGFENEIAKSAFLLSNKKKFPDDVIKGKKGYYVIRFKNRKKPPVKEFAEKKKSVVERLLQQKKYQTFNAWVTQLEGQSEISIEDGFLD